MADPAEAGAVAGAVGGAAGAEARGRGQIQRIDSVDRTEDEESWSTTQDSVDRSEDEESQATPQATSVGAKGKPRGRLFSQAKTSADETLTMAETLIVGGAKGAVFLSARNFKTLEDACW